VLLHVLLLCVYISVLFTDRLLVGFFGRQSIWPPKTLGPELSRLLYMGLK